MKNCDAGASNNYYYSTIQTFKKKDVLVLKAIIASYHKGKDMFDLVAWGQY